MDQPGKVANPARGQLNRENIPLFPCVPENLVVRDGFNRPVPRQPAHVHTQAEIMIRDNHEEVLSLQPMSPPKHLDTLPLEVDAQKV